MIGHYHATAVHIGAFGKIKNNILKIISFRRIQQGRVGIRPHRLHVRGYRRWIYGRRVGRVQMGHVWHRSCIVCLRQTPNQQEIAIRAILFSDDLLIMFRSCAVHVVLWLLAAAAANSTIFVDSLHGSDVTGDGSFGAPFATVTMASSRASQSLAREVSIVLAAGRYDGANIPIDCSVGALRMLTIVGFVCVC